jgi:hypothetical protein
MFSKQLKTSYVKERNIFILLQVSDELQRIQSLKVALAINAQTQVPRMNIILFNENAIVIDVDYRILQSVVHK